MVQTGPIVSDQRRRHLQFSVPSARQSRIRRRINIMALSRYEARLLWALWSVELST